MTINNILDLRGEDMEREYKVKIIIPVHNQYAFTELCLYSLKETTDFNKVSIVVIDNASTDNSYDELCKLQSNGYRNLTILKNDTNVGFSKAINQGMTLVTDEDVLWLNNDTTFCDEWLDELEYLLYTDNKIGIVAPMTCHATSKQAITGVDKMATSPKQVGEVLKYHHKNKAEETNFVTGFCMLIKNEVFKKVGLCDEQFVLSAEDADYCNRVYEAGYEIWMRLDTYVHHFGHVTSSDVKDFNANECWRKYAKLFKQKWEKYPNGYFEKKEYKRILLNDNGGKD